MKVYVLISCGTIHLLMSIINSEGDVISHFVNLQDHAANSNLVTLRTDAWDNNWGQLQRREINMFTYFTSAGCLCTFCFSMKIT